MNTNAGAIVSVPHSEHSLPPEPEESQLSAVLYDATQQAQVGMQSMLKMISDIDDCSAGIKDEIEKCKEQAIERKKMLEDDKERFQKAAFSVLEMLNSNDTC